MSNKKQPIEALTRRQAVQALADRALLGLSGTMALVGPASADHHEQPKGRVLLSVSGAIGRTNAADGTRRYDFDAEMIDALPVRSIRTGTPWHQGTFTFTGPLLADVLVQAGAGGSTLQMTALNDYQVRMPASEVLPHQPILARRADGAVLSVRDKGPLFLIFPFDDNPQMRTDTYYSRSIWQLKAIDVR